ncbi:MAG: hypothetical protein ABDH66_08795 [Bacteroidia bacterium]
MSWLWIFLLADSLVGSRYVWKGLTPASSGFCAEVVIEYADRILLFAWQESTGVNQWVTVEKIQVDRSDVPKVYRLCRKRGLLGQKVRIVLSTLTKSGPKSILYEGYPWGEPPPPPVITLETGKPSLLHIGFPVAGKYVLRAFNRFGEEIFTIPIDLSEPQELTFTIPSVLRGAFLIQLYNIVLQKVVAEKVLII